MLTETTPPWTFDLEQAHRVQDNLRTQLVLRWDGRTVATIGGIDFSSSGSTLHAAISIYSYPELQNKQTITGEAPQDFPYIAGHLIDLQQTIQFVLETCRGYRMPEPI